MSENQTKVDFDQYLSEVQSMEKTLVGLIFKFDNDVRNRLISEDKDRSLEYKNSVFKGFANLAKLRTDLDSVASIFNAMKKLYDL